MKAKLAAIALAAGLILAAVWAAGSLRHGNFAAAAGFDPIRADAVEIQDRDAARRTLTDREDILGLVACLNQGRFVPADGPAPASDCSITFYSGGRPIAGIRLDFRGRAVIGGRGYTVTGIREDRIRRIAGGV